MHESLLSLMSQLTSRSDGLVPLPFLFMGAMSLWHWVIVLLIIILVFGNRLPGMARNLGRSLTEFKKGVRGEGDAPKELPKEGQAGKGSDTDGK